MEVGELVRYLSGVLEFRFFTGVEGVYLNPLYDKLDPELLYYIPALSPDTAIAMANGVSIGGIKSLVFMKQTDFERVKNSVILPILIILISDSNYKPKELKSFRLTDKPESVLKRVNNYITKKEQPCVLLIN